jgi:glycosidase
LQDLGFDYTYNKRVTDFILRGQDAALMQFLQDRSPQYLRQSVHFLENHDEPRAASLLPVERHKAAAALILFLPGMALLHDGQLEGRKLFTHIQLNRRTPEAPDPEISAFYENLLTALQNTIVRRGTPDLIFHPAAPALAIQWTARNGQSDLALVNLSEAEVAFDFPNLAIELNDMNTRFRSSPAKPLRRDHSALIIPRESAHIVRIR